MRCALQVAADSSLRPKLPYSSLSVLDRYQVKRADYHCVGDWPGTGVGSDGLGKG